jgi:hypothetical protein
MCVPVRSLLLLSAVFAVSSSSGFYDYLYCNGEFPNWPGALNGCFTFNAGRLLVKNPGISLDGDELTEVEATSLRWDVTSPTPSYLECTRNDLKVVLYYKVILGEGIERSQLA